MVKSTVQQFLRVLDQENIEKRNSRHHKKSVGGSATERAVICALTITIFCAITITKCHGQGIPERRLLHTCRSRIDPSSETWITYQCEAHSQWSPWWQQITHSSQSVIERKLPPAEQLFAWLPLLLHGTPLPGRRQCSPQMLKLQLQELRCYAHSHVHTCA